MKFRNSGAINKRLFSILN